MELIDTEIGGCQKQGMKWEKWVKLIERYKLPVW